MKKFIKLSDVQNSHALKVQYMKNIKAGNITTQADCPIDDIVMYQSPDHVIAQIIGNNNDTQTAVIYNPDDPKERKA